VLTLRRQNGQIFVQLSTPRSTDKSAPLLAQTTFPETVSFASFYAFYEEAAKEWAEDVIYSPMQRLKAGLMSFAFAGS